MQKIARVLDVRPEELISAALMAGLEDDAVPYTSEDPAISSLSLSARGLAYFRVVSDAVEMADVPPGSVILIDMTQAAVDAAKTGDIVVAEVYGSDETLNATTIVRQFVAPSLLTTNRRRSNVALSLHDPDFDIVIKGVRVAA